jgi:amino acid adenylation domain-containing protein
MNSTRLRDEIHARTFPCSQSQKRFWFESQLHPENPGLNVAVRWRLEGEVSSAQLEAAWRLIVARHQTLRTSFLTIEGEPYQLVEPAVPFGVPVVDLTTLPENDAYAEADRVASLEAQRTFDITVAPLIRVTHVRVRPDVSMILVTAHHTVCDGWSIGVLAREMGQICAAAHAGRAAALDELQASYADYAAWERTWLSPSSALAAEREDLANRLAGFQQFEIVPDKPRPPVQTANGDIVSVLLERPLSDALAELARQNNCTLFMAAYAALLALLHRYSGETDIVVGTQIAGREEVAFEQLVGTFINTVALRTDVSGDPSFRELLARASDTVADALDLRYVPLEELVEIVNPKRDLSRNALFSINFVFQRSFIQNATYGAFRLIDMPSRSAGPICDLNFFMVERPDGWRTSCEFNADLYRRATVERMLDRFIRLLRAVVHDPSTPISALPMMDQEERALVVALGAGESSPYERDETVHGIFARQAALSPSAVAAVDDASQLTYAELERRSNQLAGYLRGVGVRPETAVGVALERSVDLPVVLLGVLKAGGAYVPLDPAYPRERLAFIIEDAGAQLILADRAVRDRLPNDGAPVIDLADAAPKIAAQPQDFAGPAGRADSLAYVMYTSGSSGRPKGVAIVHRAIARLVRKTNYVDIGADDTVLQYAPLAFDASTFEIWAPLLNGGRLALARPGVLSLADLGRTIDRFGVTTLWLTAAVFREAVEAGLPELGKLRRLLAGGDVVSPVHARRFLEDYPQCRLINGYGPTENTTFSCAYAIPSAAAVGESVPIGRPIANSSAYVLDDRLQPVPFGVVGELCVGGDGLSRGYVNLPALTVERFVPDPFSTDSEARLYRTGDRVRQRDDGVIEFLGRIDGQVKIRGYRIELNELEAVLSGHPNVADAAAVVTTGPSGDKTIRAYVVPRGLAPELVEVAGLRAWLGEHLPAFMLPATIVALPVLPLSSNGKVDRRALAACAEPLTHGPATYRSDTEVRLAAMLGALLGTSDIQRDADIFSLGFHSLLAVRFAADVRAAFGVELKLRSLFEHPTIAAIAMQLEASPAHVESGSDVSPIITLNAKGTRPPFTFFHGDLFAEGLYSRRLTAALGPDQPVHVVAPHGTAGLPLLPTTEAMARDYAARLRSVQPHGPYRLGGFCASGLIAYELARILRSQGEVVDKLVLMNTSPMPTKRIAAIDGLVRRIGLDARLKPRLRDRFCYHLARLHAAAITGPLSVGAVAGRMLRSIVSRSHGSGTALEPPPFEARRGVRETENSLAHVVAAFTYHPQAYDGEVTLIWSRDQAKMFNDRTMGWGGVATRVNVLSMGGGHVAAISERIGELARVLDAALQS